MLCVACANSFHPAGNGNFFICESFGARKNFFYCYSFHSKVSSFFSFFALLRAKICIIKYYTLYIAIFQYAFEIFLCKLLFLSDQTQDHRKPAVNDVRMPCRDGLLVKPHEEGLITRGGMTQCAKLYFKNFKS